MTETALAELDELERILHKGAAHLSIQIPCLASARGKHFPVYAVAMGNPSPDVPAVGFFGGIHGLERIGAEVVIAFLDSLVERLQWDSSLHNLLKNIRLVFMPVVNPGGMLLGTRANPKGVDLMRNAPLSAKESVPFLVGGHRLSARLPWYRGHHGKDMEEEIQAVCTTVEDELLSREFSLSIDCHSGFGIQDRLWFPYAHTAKPIRHLAEIHALKATYDAAYSNHDYLFEPQSHQYLAHGDVWDYLYRKSTQRHQGVFLPLTLELGSWLWVKKNPRQAFSRQGLFNPLIAHRQQRVMRRHLSLFDFLIRAVSAHDRWLPKGKERMRHEKEALTLWYPEREGTFS